MSVFKQLMLVSCVVGFCCKASIAESDLLRAQVRDHLVAGEFGPAIEKAARLPDRDHWLGQIAVAQAESGASTAAMSTLRSIQDTGGLTTTTNSIGNGAAGGASGADFDTLMDLISTTVSPDSWNDVGGPGSMEPFPGGVFVDTAGVMHRLRETASVPDETLGKIRDLGQRMANWQDDPARPSALRMVSLPRLQRELQIGAAFGRQPTEEMLHLAGIRQVKYVFVYPDSKDVVIAGPAGRWETDEEGRAVGDDGSPVLLLDDLVVLLRSLDREGRFGCSITPKRENLAKTQAFLAAHRGSLKPRQTPAWMEQLRSTLGLQDVDLHGIDAQSHVARVLVEADYHMKLVGMGLVPSVAGLESYLDSVDPKSPPRMDVLRWWFTLHDDSITKNASGTAYRLADQTVRLQSENELLEVTGDRVHTGKSSDLNLRFAASFTSHFDQLAKKYPVYAQLKNVFDLALVAALIRHEQLPEAVQWDMDGLLQPTSFSPAQGDVPLQVPSIVNFRIIGGKQIIAGVSGGVSVHTKNVMLQLRSTESQSLSSERDRSRTTLEHSSDRWWWDF